MGLRRGITDSKKREGHEFHSCRFALLKQSGFSRWGIPGVPQGLKPFSRARHFGTTGSRALPDCGEYAAMNGRSSTMMLRMTGWIESALFQSSWVPACHNA